MLKIVIFSEYWDPEQWHPLATNLYILTGSWIFLFRVKSSSSVKHGGNTRTVNLKVKTDIQRHFLVLAKSAWRFFLPSSIWLGSFDREETHLWRRVGERRQWQQREESSPGCVYILYVYMWGVSSPVYGDEGSSVQSANKILKYHNPPNTHTHTPHPRGGGGVRYPRRTLPRRYKKGINQKDLEVKSDLKCDFGTFTKDLFWRPRNLLSSSCALLSQYHIWKI